MIVCGYDPMGRIIKETESGALGGDTARGIGYNAAGELAAFSESSPDGEVLYEYSYDMTGNRTELKKSGAGVDEAIMYTYDSAGQLISEGGTLTGLIRRRRRTWRTAKCGQGKYQRRPLSNSARLLRRYKARCGTGSSPILILLIMTSIAAKKILDAITLPVWTWDVIKK